ncbi:hypothetical protein ABVT39_014943 [Epinephelus coioides]
MRGPEYERKEREKSGYRGKEGTERLCDKRSVFLGGAVGRSKVKATGRFDLRPEEEKRMERMKERRKRVCDRWNK